MEFVVFKSVTLYEQNVTNVPQS